MTRLALPAAISALLATTAPALADPSFGIGISIVSTGEAAIGFRIFSNDRPGRGVVALGLDYKLKSETLRPTLGAAWLEDNFYVDLSVGLDSGSGQLDFGAGLGYAANTRRPAAPATPPPTTGGTGTGTTDTTGTTDAVTRMSF